MAAPHPFLRYWQEAIGSPFGIGIQFEGDPGAVKTALYTARAKANDPLFSAVSVRTSPRSPKSELWLVVDRSQLPSGSGSPSQATA